MVPWAARGPISWLSPEEVVEVGLSRSRVLTVNEAHDGLKRCVRTRRLGLRMLPVAWKHGARVLAMEALGAPGREAEAKTTYRYMQQPEMRELVAEAERLGFVLCGYECDMKAAPPDLRQETRSKGFMNWRERRQADNLVELFGSLPADWKLMVWCGWGHHSKVAMPGPEGFKPMGWWFRRLARLESFAIDQTQTVESTHRAANPLLDRYRSELQLRGGTAGFLVRGTRRETLGVDAWLLSTDNTME